MTELSLFTGAGGGVWASKLLGHRIVGYVEREKFCQEVIRQRIRDGLFDDAPVFDDVRTFNGLPYRGRVDIVSAGFPCQPFSTAGKRLGAKDERNMWPDTLRILNEVRPRWALLENVPGLIRSGYFETILQGLAESGYDARWTVLGASDLGARHYRKRVWILAYPHGQRLRLQPLKTQPQPARKFISDFRWSSEPEVDRVVYGMAGRRNRARALGNGQVPVVAAAAFRLLTEE